MQIMTQIFFGYFFYYGIWKQPKNLTENIKEKLTNNQENLERDLREIEN